MRTSDPYVKIKVGNKIVGTTAVFRFTLAPEWKESFRIPLLHLYHNVTLELWDHDELRPHKMLGKVEFRVDSIPIDGDEPIVFESNIQKGESNIEPCGTLFYSVAIKVSIKS